MQQNRIPRISTRGYYDLSTGKTLKKKHYDLYPKKFFEKLNDSEFTIIVHGLRNDKKGALLKFRLAQKRLGQLGYKQSIVGFSYDSNIRGVQYKSTVIRATKIGQIVAKKASQNLAKFITDVNQKFPNVKINLIGHSLGTEVITHMLFHLKQKSINNIYFFGSSLPVKIARKNFATLLQKTISGKLINFYNPDDDVLKQAAFFGIILEPLGCVVIKKKIKKYQQKRIYSKNHRFASYMHALSRFD